MECAGATPEQGKTYDISVEIGGMSPWWQTETTEMERHTINAKYVYEGDERAYVGTYSCKQPLDNDSQQICGEDPTKWEFKQHPMFHYNEYDFQYPSESNDAKIVGAYWTEWAAYKRFKAESVDTPTGPVHSPARRYYAQNSPFHQLTHVLYAFVPVCGNGPDGEGQLALCAVNDCASEDPEDLKFGNPYFNLRARACKFDRNGNEAATAAGSNLDSDFELALHDPWSAFHIGGGQLLAMESVKQQYPDLKILPSVGGWTLSKMFYYLDNSANRTKFVNSCEKFLRTWKIFDGIDIDWEFPGGGGQDDGVAHDVLTWPLDSDAIVGMDKLHADGKLRKETLVNINMSNTTDPMHDAATYTLLMKDLRAMLDRLGNEFGRKLELSSAVSAGQSKISKVNYGDVADEMDHIFIMSYDLDGAWSQKVGHQTNLYPHPDKPAMDSCSSAAEAIEAQGFPMNKLVMGAAMYGRGWQNVGEGTPSKYIDENGNEVEAVNYWGHGSAATGITGCEGDVEQGVVDYSTIAKAMSYNMCDYFYDTCAEAPIANCQGQVYTYDDARSVAAKGKYVQEKGMGGIFAWVLDQDNGDILNAMHESVGNKVTKGTPILKAGGYPARSCNNVPPLVVDPAVPTSAPTTTTNAVTPAGDMKCCVKVDQIDFHANCNGTSANSCNHNACAWVEASTCVDAVYNGGDSPVIVPTTETPVAPVTTAQATQPVPVTTAAPTTTTTRATTRTTTTATTTAAVTVPPSGDCKNLATESDCNSAVTNSWDPTPCTNNEQAWNYGQWDSNKHVGFACAAACAAKEPSKTCAEWSAYGVANQI